MSSRCRGCNCCQCTCCKNKPNYGYYNNQGFGQDLINPLLLILLLGNNGFRRF